MKSASIKCVEVTRYRANLTLTVRHEGQIMIRRHRVAAGCLILGFLALLACATTPVPPLTTNQVAGAWVGYEDYELTFFRLELATNGTGRCASVCVPSTELYKYGVSVYDISKWELDGIRISFDIVPLSTNAEPIYMNGTVTALTMDLVVGGTNMQWKRTLVLRPEESFLIPNRDTSNAIHRIAEQHGGRISSEGAPSAPPNESSP